MRDRRAERNLHLIEVRKGKPWRKENSKGGRVDLNESSVYGKDANDNHASDEGDTATEETLDRLEQITGGADEPGVYEGKLGRAVNRLDASTDEEIDALKSIFSRTSLWRDRDVAREGLSTMSPPKVWRG